jgi:hypothetical protein
LSGQQAGREALRMVVKMRKVKDGHRVLERVYANPRYRGKHLIVVEDEVFVARSAAEAPRLFDRVIRAHPGATPTLIYVPRADALILWIIA